MLYNPQAGRTPKIYTFKKQKPAINPVIKLLKGFLFSVQVYPPSRGAHHVWEVWPVMFKVSLHRVVRALPVTSVRRGPT